MNSRSYQLAPCHHWRCSCQVHPSQFRAHLAEVSFGHVWAGARETLGRSSAGCLEMRFRGVQKHSDATWGVVEPVMHFLPLCSFHCTFLNISSNFPIMAWVYALNYARCFSRMLCTWKVEQFDVFLSHTWHTRGIWKWLSLSLQLTWPHILLCTSVRNQNAGIWVLLNTEDLHQRVMILTLLVTFDYATLYNAKDCNKYCVVCAPS